MPSLDGLRALAVTAVLLYHADVAWLPGGFLGVDVFFVLSGYLITALLLAEWHTRGTIDLGGFWLRRARRLLPALFAVIAITLTFALIWLPDEVARLRGDALAALAYVTNWYLIFKQESYFETIGRPSLFQHLWSLAVEEQFYLLWPPLLAVVLRRRGRRGALLLALGGAIASAALLALRYQPDVDPSRLYYGTDTRALAPLLGAALACFRPPAFVPLRAGRAPALLIDAAALAALTGLAAACCLLDEYQSLLYQGGFVIVALLAAVLIAALVHPSAALSWRLLSSRPLRWLGTRSYAIYLWHWPIFMITRPELDLTLDGWPLLALRLVAVALLAELSYELVEAPFRAGALGQAWRGLRDAHGARRWRLGIQWSASAALAIGLAVLLGVAVAEARPPAAPPELAIEAVRDAPLVSAATTTATSEPAPAPTVIRPSPSAMAPHTYPAHTAAALTTIDELELDVASLKRSAVWAPADTRPASTATLPPAATPAPPPPSATAAPSPPAPEAAVIAAAPTAQPSPPASPAESAPVPPAEPPPAPSPADAPPAPALRVTAIGDSVMVGAARQLRAAIGDITIDAAVARQAKTAINILQAQRDAGQLGDVVIVHMGTNGPLSARQFDQIMAVLADVRRVVFVTVKVPRRWQAPNNAVIAEGVPRYPNAVLADWYTASAGRPELFARDGVHPQRVGARLYAEVIAAAVNAP
jgi:peptidoglycan/LPS O-acetylase OafA/YrhL